MATYGGKDYTTFSNVNLKGGGLRTESEGGYAITLPSKTGTLPIMGTFRIQLPSAAAAEFSTIATVSGIRAEDALVVQLNGVGVAGTTYGFDNSTGYIITQAVPGNGNITLFFQNPGNATAYVDLTASYIAMR